LYQLCCHTVYSLIEFIVIVQSFVVVFSAGWIFDQTNHQIIGQNMKKGQLKTFIFGIGQIGRW